MGKNKKPDDVAYFMALGAIAFKWAHIEKSLEFTLWDLADLKEKNGVAITTHMSIPQKLQSIRSLGHIKFKQGKVLKKLEFLVKQTEKLSVERNNFLHGLWENETDSENWSLINFKSRGKIKAEIRPVSCKEILLVEREIDALGEQWTKFHKDHLGDSSPLSDKPSQQDPG